QTARRNDRYLPQVELPDGVTAAPVSEIELAGGDLVVFAVPASALRNAVGGAGARIGERTAVLVLSKGLVPSLGALPSHYVRERGVRPGAVGAALGGAAEGVESVPLLASACARTGVDAPATEALASLVEGRIAPERLIEDVRAGGRRAA